MLATAEQYAAMLDSATASGYAFAAVNVTSSQTLNAALRGFAEAGADGIVQITLGGARYLSGAARDPAAGARALAALTAELARRLPITVALHTDHCPPEHVDGFLRSLLASSEDRVRHGERPWFHSHMFDGSSLPLDDNLRLSADLLERCRELDVLLEIECGVVGGEEDGIGGEHPDTDRLYTTPEDLLRVADALGTGERGSYLLAATFGNIHGLYAPRRARLRPEILAAGQEALTRAHPGSRFRYVFHGSSGSSAAELKAAIAHGVVKVNLDSDAQLAFTRAAAWHMFSHYDRVLPIDGGLPDKRAYDPREWGEQAEAGMACRVAQACELLGSAARSILA